MDRSTKFRVNPLSTRAVTTVLVALVVLLAGCSSLGIGSDDSDVSDGNESMPFMNHTEAAGTDRHTETSGVAEIETKKSLHRSELVTFENQTSEGATVTVRKITIPNGGYAVVHDRHFLDSTTPSAIGVSEYLEPGTHENVTVTLYDVPSRHFSQAARLTGTNRLFVVPHRETGTNQTPELGSGERHDRPYLNETDHIHYGTAIVTFESD